LCCVQNAIPKEEAVEAEVEVAAAEAEVILRMEEDPHREEVGCWG